MDPLTLTAISLVVSNLAQKAFDKSFETATEEVTKSSFEWLKSLFFKQDGSPKEELKELRANPTDSLNQDSAALVIKKSLRDEPDAEKYLTEIAKFIKDKGEVGSQHNIIQHSKNVNTGSVTTSGNFNIGDSIHP
jgi:hypothetical protein